MSSHPSGADAPTASLIELLQRHAAQRPEAPAYTFLAADGETEAARLTWGGLAGRVRAVATALEDGGAARRPVLLLFPAGLDFVTAFLGCLEAGAVAVPAYPPRHGRALQRLATIVADAEPGAILTTAEVAAELEGAAASAPTGSGAALVAALPRLSAEDVERAAGNARDRPLPASADLAFLQYTSGSTGTAKGVRVRHGNLVHNTEAIRRAFAAAFDGAAPVIVSWLPLYHDMGLIGNALEAIATGSHCVLMAPTTFLQDPARWLRAVSRYRGTFSGGPNFAYELCARRVPPEALSGLDLSSWRVAFNGAEPVRAATLERFAETFGSCGFRASALHPCYGLAECTLVVSGARREELPVVLRADADALERHRVRPAADGRPLVSCGEVASGLEVRIVDPESGVPCTAGEVGEIWIRGPSVADGYWRRRAASVETFGARLAADGRAAGDGSSADAAYLRTGDLGHLDAAGRLFITGRAKDLIILRGRNYYPQDLEQTAEAAHPALRPGCGAAFAEGAFAEGAEAEGNDGGGERLVVVHEVRLPAGADGAALDIEEIAGALRQAVAAEHEIQVHEVVLIPPRTLPKTTSGKVRRRACRELLRGGRLEVLGRSAAAPTPAGRESPRGGEAEGAEPRRADLLELAPAARHTALGESLLRTAAGVLGVDPDRLDPGRALTAAGLDSLSAVELKHQLETRLEVPVSLSALLDGASPEELLEHLTAGLDEEALAPLERYGGDPGEPFALSFMQEALWFFAQMAPESPAYNISLATRLGPRVELDALGRALAALVARHGALRATVGHTAGGGAAAGDAALQRVHVSMPIVLERIELDAAEAGEGEATEGDGADAELDRRLSEHAHRPFDLDRGPLLRAAVFTRGAERVLLLTVHHLAIDGWSLWLLLDELGRLYPAARAAGAAGGRGADSLAALLPPLAAEYRDYVRWHRRLVEGPAGEAMWRYWRRRLGAPPALVRLPYDHRRRRVESWSGAALPIRLDPGGTEGLRQLARAADTTLYAAFLALFQVLLGRHGDQRDVLVGSPVSGRSRPELEGLVGCFFNAVGMRGDLGAAPGEGEPSFRRLLERTRGVVAAALDHQDYPSHLLAERLQPGGHAHGALLFPAMLLYQKLQRFGDAVAAVGAGTEIAARAGSLGLRLDFGELVLEPLFFTQQAARADLELELVEGGGRVVGWLRYRDDLFEAATIERLGGQLVELVTGVLAAPDAALGEISFLSAAERRQLEAWSRPARPAAPAESSVHGLVQAVARRAPERIAAVEPGRDDGGGRVLSYGALDRAAGRLAARLLAAVREAGSPGTEELFVGLLVEPGLALPLGLLGILEAGAAFVPLDPQNPVERLAVMAGAGRLRAVVTDAAHLETARALAARLPALRLVRVETGPAAARGGMRSAPVWVEPEPLRAACTIYTSGSTGTPKGVVIPHRNLATLLAWSGGHFGLGERTRVLQSLSYGFDFWVCEILTTLAHGGCLTLLDRQRQGDLPRRAEHLRRARATVLHATPSILRETLEAAGEGGLPTVQVLHVGGEPLSRALAGASFAAAPAATALHNGFGPTEATVNCATWRLPRAAAGSLAALSAVPVGRATVAAVLRLVDRRGRPVPVGVPGELWIGGEGVARGYARRPAATAERFVPDPFGPGGGRLYRSGDLVRFRGDGSLLFLGRNDQQVKVRGFRIELGEVEEALASHPAVAEGAVAARPAGTGEAGSAKAAAQLVAYAAPRRGLTVSGGELRRFLEERLPPYMVPTAYVLLEALPRTARSKVDRAALPAPARQRDPDAAYVAPRGPVEEVVAEVCAAVLGLERVGRGDNLFHYGCHSILATKIVARLREAFGTELELTRLFADPTVAGLAAGVEDTLARAGEALDLPPLEPAPRDEPLPLSFAQERLWFLHQLDPAAVAYHVPRALRVEGDLPVALLERAMSEVVRRHEILRTSFPERDGVPVQRIHPPWEVRIPTVDLAGLPAEARQREVARRIVREGRRPFDIEALPLLRLQLLRTAPEEHVLVLNEHHFVHDGWTQGVLLRELLDIYRAFARDEPSPLSELEIQFADFARWQRRWLRGAVLERQLAYWRERLAGAPELLEMPTDHPRPAVASAEGRLEILELPGVLATEIRRLGREHGATLFMTLLAAFEALLARWSGQTDLSVGTGVANRRLRATEHMLGMVINTLVLRSDLGGDPSFGGILRRLREVCLGAYAHQDTPFEKVVETLNPERSLSRTPLFQVMFSILDTPLQDLELPGLRLSQIEAHNRSAKWDLGVTVLPRSEQRVGLYEEAGDSPITLWLQYKTELFEATTVRRLLGQLRRLLASVCADPALRLSELPLLGTAERHQVLVEWNDTAAAPRRAPPVQEWIAARAARVPDAVAVVGGIEGGGIGHLSYGELLRRARRGARRLRDRGVVREQVVGVRVERSLELVTVLLAVLEAGAGYLPLDPEDPPERQSTMLADAGAVLVLTRPECATLCERPAGGRMPAASPDADALVYQIYTSGSTGRPKGTAVPQRAVCNQIAWLQGLYGLGGEDRVAQKTPLSFDVSVWELLWPLTAGACLVLARPAGHRDPASLLDLVARQRLTTLHFVPSMLQAFLAQGEAAATAPACRSLRRVVISGEALPAEMAARARRVFPAARMHNMYGPSEAARSSAQPLPAPEGRLVVPLGRPSANTRLLLADRHLRPVPIGVIGEVVIGGAQLARGYHRRPGLTAERFVPDPWGGSDPGGKLPGMRAGQRLYRSGDLARHLPDGRLEFLGRRDFQVKLRGFRVELGEVEAALRRLPRVAEAAARMVGASAAEHRLAAYVVVRGEGPPPGVEELRGALAKHLPDFMVPSLFVFLEHLPLTASGKVDRRALPAPDQARPALAEDFVGPRDETEEAVASIWLEVLDLERVGVHDDFFHLGGQSLLATQVLSRVRRRFQVEVPLRGLFETPTVAHLARLVEEAELAAAGIHEIEGLLGELEGLSPEDVERLLTEEGLS